jgi:hypothetical protein
MAARMYVRINRARSSKARKRHEPGPTFIRVGNYLALVCLFLGAAFAVFVSGSFEQRIGNLLIFGLMPAVGFYATSHMLGQLLIFGVKLCDMLIARCSRRVLLVAQDLLSWAGIRCLKLMTELRVKSESCWIFLAGRYPLTAVHRGRPRPRIPHRVLF